VQIPARNGQPAQTLTSPPNFQTCAENQTKVAYHIHQIPAIIVCPSPDRMMIDWNMRTKDYTRVRPRVTIDDMDAKSTKIFYELFYFVPDQSGTYSKPTY
jgi:hypothetical protein